MIETGLARTADGQVIYEPDGKVLRQFLRDRSHIAIIRGPVGSGTSVGCCMRAYSHALEQRPQRDGKRRTRGIVIRDSYPNLRNTTIRTWLEWFPVEQYGRFFWDRPCRHEIRIGDVELDVIFLSLDDEGDVAKCRSMEFTWAWFNELEYTRKLLFDEVESRTGRYPAMKDGGATWHGVIADMNAPDETHWLPKMTGEVSFDPDDDDEEVQMAGLPVGWAYFVQPPALLEIRERSRVVGYRVNPEAENTKWLPPHFYEEKSRGKSKAWIDSRLRNQITFVIDGSAVFKGFNPDTHISPEILKPVRDHEVVIGVDFGFGRPAAVCGQVIDGRIYIQYEFRRYNTSAAGFAPEFKRFLERTYAGHRFRIWGDPKGQDRGQADGRTSYDVFDFNGLPVTAAPVKMNAWETRVAVVEFVLNDGTGGFPRFQLSPGNCPTLKAAMCGRYHIKKNQAGDPKPFKDKFSDIADALQYLLLGIGEGRTMIGLEAATRAVVARTTHQPGRWRLGARKVS